MDPVVGAARVPEGSVTGLVICCHLHAAPITSCEALIERLIQVNWLVYMGSQPEEEKKSALKRLVSVVNQQLLNFANSPKAFQTRRKKEEEEKNSRRVFRAEPMMGSVVPLAQR